MFYLKNKRLSLFILLVVILNNPTHAGNEEIIEIKAQYLLLDDNKGISKYKGDVLFTKGTLVIKADTVTLFYKNKILIRALITGAPADLKHHPINEEKVHSQANKMEFFVNEDRVILKGNAFVDQGSRYFSGEYIEYDARQGIITASSNKNKPHSTKTLKNTPPRGRVHVIIGPTENNTAKNNN